MATEIYSLPASTSLLNEFNALAPGRDKTQDGTIGDRAHMERVSDHNLDEIGNTGTHHDTDKIREVHARDVDSRGPWPAGWSMERIVQAILARCRSGAEKRLLYIIYNGRIWEASNGWRERTYTGADQHTLHAHFSFQYGSGAGTSNPENITAPWGFLAAFKRESGHVDAKDVSLFWNQDGIITNPSERSDAKTNPTVRAAFAVGDSWARIIDLQTAIAAQNKAIVALASKDAIDERAFADMLAPAVAAAVLAALPPDTAVTPEALTAGIVSALRELAAQ